MRKTMKTSIVRAALMVTSLALTQLTVVHAGQRHFVSAEQAADTLVVAIARNDRDTVAALFGDEYRDILPDDGVSADQLERFVQGWTRFNTLTAVDDRTRVLAVGENGWTFPVPIIRDVEGWRFDTETGRSQIIIRQIGRNELAVIQAALAYHDAQMEYATEDHDNDGVLEYAQRFLSRPGQRDGLYWETESGQPQSPLGPLLARHDHGDDYHGYRFRILTAQGEHAPGGSSNYIAGDNMTEGFGLIAWPAVYGKTGVKSFLLGRNGVLYETDLGADGATFASATSSFDPDRRWTPVDAGFLVLDD
jgi:hypothetical protein